ncbi:MAG TPA: hypothetical protein VI791_03085 [Patescibacteria group bacterium]|nr:hypothetical protein [Patescibacteria group bacterium]
MFDGLMQAMSSGTMEERYLAMIAFLDKAESLSNEASPALNVAIAKAKQMAIDEFAARNKTETHDVIVARAEKEK